MKVRPNSHNFNDLLVLAGRKAHDEVRHLAVRKRLQILDSVPTHGHMYPLLLTGRIENVELPPSCSDAFDGLGNRQAPG